MTNTSRNPRYAVRQNGSTDCWLFMQNHGNPWLPIFFYNHCIRDGRSIGIDPRGAPFGGVREGFVVPAWAKPWVAEG